MRGVKRTRIAETEGEVLRQGAGPLIDRLRQSTQRGAARRGTAGLVGMPSMPLRILRPRRRDVQRRPVQRGTAAWLGMPSIQRRLFGIQRAIATLVPWFLGGVADDGGDGGGDQLADRMAGLNV